MADTHTNPDRRDREPILKRAFSPDEQNHPVITTLRVAERLHIVFHGLVYAANDGEAYETLVRRIQAFHGDLEELSAMANHALNSILPGVSGLPPRQT